MQKHLAVPGSSYYKVDHDGLLTLAPAGAGNTERPPYCSDELDQVNVTYVSSRNQL